MINQTRTAKPTHNPWGTLEELLLACAVNRHGTNSWDSVSAEIIKRCSSSNPSSFTSLSCKRKFQHLKRSRDASAILHDLRTRRIADLKLDLHRHDSSIVSLQSTVKKLSDEREKSLAESGRVDSDLPVNGLDPARAGEESCEGSTARTAAAEVVRLGKSWEGDFLEVIGDHGIGSVFGRRLHTQETSNYKKTIRQHIDLTTIRAKIEEGEYKAHPSKFRRDLLLLATNAATFFPRTSREHKSATQLRHLISTKLTLPSLPTKAGYGEPECTQRIQSPVIVCRKRSSAMLKKRDGGGEEKKEKKKSVAGFLNRIKKGAGEEVDQSEKRSAGRPPKRVAAVAGVGKRRREGGGGGEVAAKKKKKLRK